eukprot:scaffold5143_cov119-Isochrysis_galbana.AAC.9
MDHTVPTVGYVLDEISRPGALHANRIHPILKAHDLPLKLLREFKTGTPIPLPTGTSTRCPSPHKASNTVDESQPDERVGGTGRGNAQTASAAVSHSSTATHAAPRPLLAGLDARP